MLYTGESLVIPETLELQQAGLLAGLRDWRGADLKQSDQLADSVVPQTDRVQIFRGRQAVKNWGISVVGSGARVRGSINGTIKTNDFKAAYQVYNLPTTSSAGVWFLKYSKASSVPELKQTFEKSIVIDASFNLTFELQGNDFGITAVFITYQVIRMQLNGVTKDFVVTNPESAGAASPDGTKYPGDFIPVPAEG
jgi:hypothetical protein